MVVEKIIHKQSGTQYGGWALTPNIGYPLASGGSEWERKQFDVKLRMEKDYAEIELTADSIERPGLRLSTFLRVYAGRELFSYYYRFTNTGSSTLKDLAVRIGGWMDFYFDQMHIPIRGEIYKLNSCEWHGGRHLPKTPDYYHEDWMALTKKDGSVCIGYIWDRERLKEIIPKRSWGISVFEYTLPDLSPGDTHEQRLFDLLISQGDWKRVRALWARTNGVSLTRELLNDTRSDLELEIVREGEPERTVSGSPVLIDIAGENKLEVRARVLSEEPISAEIVIHLPAGLKVEGKNEVSLKAETITIESPFKKLVSVTAEDTDQWILTGGEMKYIDGGRIYAVPLTAILYDSKVSPQRQTETISGLQLHTLTSGKGSMSVCGDYGGTLTRFGPAGEASYFYDTFPEAKPFVWWDKHFSGLKPIIWSTDVWDWETALHKEKWSVKEISVGFWDGYDLSSTLEHSIKLQGVFAHVRYLQLRNAPVVFAEIKAENRTKQWKELYLGFTGSPRLNGKPQSWIHAVANGDYVAYEPTDTEADVRVSPEAGWVAYREPESGKVLGIVSTCHTGQGMSADNLGANAQLVWLRERRLVAPGGETSLSCYVLAAPSVESVRLLRGIPALKK